jgi:hypothetical protein
MGDIGVGWQLRARGRNSKQVCVQSPESHPESQHVEIECSCSRKQKNRVEGKFELTEFVHTSHISLIDKLCNPTNSALPRKL